MSLGRVTTVIAILFVAGTIAISQWDISSVLPEATDHAKSIDWIFKYMAIASWLVFLIVQGFLVAFVFRYKQKPGEDPEALGVQIHGNTRLEVIWTAIPTLFIISLAVISLKVYIDIVANQAHPYNINAIGFQFGWECDHPQYKITELNTCHMPVNTEITVHLHSRDVIHSFWVAEFRVKQDAVPGLNNVMHFKTERVGQYRLICAELCGAGHSQMYAQLYVLSAGDWKKWVASQTKATSAQAPLTNASFSKDIQPLFAAHCAACHINQQLGGLNLANYQGLVKGGNVVAGSIFTAGDHKKSTLWQIVQSKAPWPGGNQMPLGGPYLKQSEVDAIAAWIDQGAKDN